MLISRETHAAALPRKKYVHHILGVGTFRKSGEYVLYTTPSVDDGPSKSQRRDAKSMLYAGEMVIHEGTFPSHHSHVFA